MRMISHRELANNGGERHLEGLSSPAEDGGFFNFFGCGHSIMMGFEIFLPKGIAKACSPLMVCGKILAPGFGKIRLGYAKSASVKWVGWLWKRGRWPALGRCDGSPRAKAGQKTGSLGAVLGKNAWSLP
jgi:hypothetical protein